MVAEDILYRYDPRKIRVLSGDIPGGYWELHGCKLVKSGEIFGKSDKAGLEDELNLDGCIDKVEVNSVQDANPGANMLGVGVGALAGFRFFGPIGAIGGAVAGQLLVGNRHEMTLNVTLSGGKTFVAQMDKAVYNRLKLVAERSPQYSAEKN